MEQVFLYLIALCTLMAAVGEIRFAGFAFRGWSWVIVLIVSGLLLLPNRLMNPVRTKWFSWLPWIGWMALKTDFHQSDAAQRFFIFITPVLCLWITSSFTMVTCRMIFRCFRIMFYGSVLLYVLATIHAGSFQALTPWYSTAGIAMTFTLLGIAAMAEVPFHPVSALVKYAICVMIMFVTESRMPIILLPLMWIIGYGSLSLRGRFLAAVFIVLCGFILFSSTPVQESIFHDGQGTLQDVLTLNPDKVNLSGRLNAWPIYVGGIENVWLGDGSTASVAFGQNIFGAGKWSHPHNEYIRIVFDYGLLGGLLLCFPILLMIRDLNIRGSFWKKEGRSWLLHVSLNGILVMLLLGISGNSLMYIAYIGNAVFATIGCAIAIEKSGDISR
ncbi:MAG: O-antigen ligase family protein [Sedimentisphaerales bacterium]|nr:O-antigen ligase family protein [Sedimentisphaerales bacterium]